MKRWFPLVLLFSLAAPVLAQEQQPTLQKIRTSGAFTIGARSDALPFSYLDANKKPVGYGIEICNEIANRLKTELKLASLRVDYVPVTAATRWEVVKTGKADLE